MSLKIFSMNTSWSIVAKSFCLILLFPLGLFAQNDPLLTHFMYYEQVYNPAHAGNAITIDVGIVGREQWTGFDDAPSQQVLNAYGYIPKIKGGLGLVLINDRLGAERNVNAKISYAYRQRVGDNAFLSGGLSVGIINRAVKGGELIFQDSGDQSAVNNFDNKLKQDIGLGLEFSGYNFIAGLSITHLDQSKDNATLFKVPRHYYAYAKYNWQATEQVVIQPALFVRSSVFITQADVAVTATFNKRITTGLIYRSSDDAGMLLGVHFSKFFVSYTFDFDFGTLSKNQSGSHELSIIAKFGGIKDKRNFYRSPRYFN